MREANNRYVLVAPRLSTSGFEYLQPSRRVVHNEHIALASDKAIEMGASKSTMYNKQATSNMSSALCFTDDVLVLFLKILASSQKLLRLHHLCMLANCKPQSDSLDRVTYYF